MSEASGQRPLCVFLCHASQDKPAVRDLHRRLTVDGFAPWLDEEDLLPGQKWREEIPKVVRHADVVLVCLSQYSINKEGYVQKEIKFALEAADEKPDGTIFLIPLRLEECDVPDRLTDWQWVNFYEDGGYVRLVRALRQRAADLKVAASASAPTPALQPDSLPAASVINNISGGVNVDANNVNVGNDIVGRDKIIHADTYIEHATIIQSGSSAQDIKPTIEVSVPIATASSPSNKVLLPGEIWLNDPNNHRIIGGMEFVRVPAGKFIMGSNDRDNERPQHTGEISYDFWIGKYPVTNGQFAQFVAATKYQFDQGDWKRKTNHPVVNVSWHDAMAYCRWLNELTCGEVHDLTLRLPTEAEWEKAARGADGRVFPWGNDFDQNKCNSSEGGKSGTTPVGAYSPQGDSPYGVVDMAGNVWEWCHSLYKFYPYLVGDGRENEVEDGARMLRGGSWVGNQVSARCAFRNGKSPANRYDLYGLRYLLSPYKDGSAPR